MLQVNSARNPNRRLALALKCFSFSFSFAGFLLTVFVFPCMAHFLAILFVTGKCLLTWGLVRLPLPLNFYDIMYLSGTSNSRPMAVDREFEYTLPGSRWGSLKSCVAMKWVRGGGEALKPNHTSSNPCGLRVLCWDLLVAPRASRVNPSGPRRSPKAPLEVNSWPIPSLCGHCWTIPICVGPFLANRILHGSLPGLPQTSKGHPVGRHRLPRGSPWASRG